MHALTVIQTINGPNGKPVFVVIPYAEYLNMHAHDWIPQEVVRRSLTDGISPARAWREYFRLTQAEVATRLGITQSAYAQQESRARLRASSREKIAFALGIVAGQLNF